MDIDQAAELYRQGCDTVLITRRPQDFFISAYRWCFNNSSNAEIGISPYINFNDHLDICIGEASKFSLGLTQSRLTGYAEHSWAGPSLQFEADISSTGQAPSLSVELGSDTMFDICKKLKGYSSSKYPTNTSKKSIPAKVNTKISRKMQRLYTLNKRWAGYSSVDSNFLSKNNTEPESKLG